MALKVTWDSERKLPRPPLYWRMVQAAKRPLVQFEGKEL